MIKTLTLTLKATAVGLFLSTVAVAQSSYPNPYFGRPPQRDARLAYLAAQRAKASVPVNYTFPVRPDIATAYSAAAYSPQYQYSRYVSPHDAQRYTAAGFTYPNAGQTSYRPTPIPYTSYANPSAAYRAEGSSCSPTLGFTGADYRAASAPRGDARRHYVGTSLAGPPKVYPRDEPVRNLFRYLFP